MRKLILLLSILFVGISSYAQQIQPPPWTISLSNVEVKAGDEIEIVIKTNAIPKDWYVYGSNIEIEYGPIPATLDFDSKKGFKTVGKFKSIGAHTHYDDVFEGDVITFDDGKAEFRQKIKITDAPTYIKGTFNYQMCSQITGMCVLFDEEFSLPIKFIGKPAETTTATANTDETDAAIIDTADNKDSAINNTESKEEPAAINEGPCEEKVFKGDTLEGGPVEEEESYWGFFILAFLSGLAALLTPCVFPMIPMTVSFFMKDGGNRAKAIRTGLIYAISIIAIYTVIGTLVAVLFGADAANFLSTHWLPNTFFFVIFIVFAASFFGMFEIIIPNSLITKIDKKADQGGLVGVFFMAFTLVLVSFSCTGPIIGNVLVLATQGDFTKPLIGMFGFSLAFALPFGLFAIFPGWLSNLPKSGGWLNSVKVILGFLELGFAFKFLSIADQTYHWGILDREIYLAIWIVIAILMGMYLIGKIKFAHDSDMPYLKVPRMLLAIVSFSFAVYLLPGMFGASLPGMAGYLPPMSTHDFNIPAMIEEVNNDGEGVCEEPLYENLLHFPHGIKGYFEYEQGIRCARELGKPVLIDFTGHGCVNCRKMEEKVWADPAVLKKLKEDYVVLSLYVDDKTELPEDQWKVSKVTGKTLKTIGKINADLQICLFNRNAQPWYILMDPNDEELLAHPRGTQGPSGENYNVQEYADYLDAGLKLFKEKHPELKEKK